MVSRGFRLVDTAITLRCDAPLDSRRNSSETLDFSVDKARSQDRRQVELIASSGFRHSRFHLDPNFPNDIADEIKRSWASNLVLGERGDGCLVARRNDRVVGFLGYASSQDEDFKIDLIAVAKSCRGKGIGSGLVSALQHLAYKQGYAVTVGTQAVNSGSVRLYESLGFRFHSAYHVMHGYSEVSVS